MTENILNKKNDLRVNRNKDIFKESYIWNLSASLLFGFQSVILLIVLTRTVGLEDVGIFTISYANASLLLFLGKYGVRNYQVSDVNEDHTFGDYKIARCISVGLMIAVAMGYTVFAVLVQNYSAKKSWIIFFMCLYKVPDAIEDVFFGEYQRKGRLDIAAKAMTVRLGFAITSFILLVAATKDLLLSLIFATVFSFITMFFLLKRTVGIFEMKNRVDKKSVLFLLRDCFPLFAGSFLAQYIGNAPKYAIDAQLSDELQAYYGFIAMPVFIIGLLNNVIFAPIIDKMAEYWKMKKKNFFLKRFLIQIIIVIGINLVCVIGAYMIGIPILSLLYNTDLHEYRNELLILLLGGGFLAISGLLNIVVTIMRFQSALLWGYFVVSILAFLFSNYIIDLYGIAGAAWLYTGLMGILCIFFLVIFIVGFRRN